MKALRLQIIVLTIGTAFAFWTVIQDYLRFYSYEGTIFKVQDCIFPNPVTTPCFWGAWGFLVALIWSFMIYRNKKGSRLKKQRNLVFFLIAGTIFAWFNSLRDIIEFFTASVGEPTVGCSGQLVTNPFTTPCFIGSSLFLLSLLFGVWCLQQLRSSSGDRP